MRCQLGEPAAFDALVERWNGPLWRCVRRLVGDEDDDADTLQEVWLRILRGLPGLRDPARLRSWLFGITRRALMDRLRRQYVEPVVDSAFDEISAAEPATQLPDDLDELQEELASMPLVEREVLVLFYLQELPLEQAALLLTEEGLPTRSRFAFAAIALAGLAWAVFALWVLARRHVLFALHRVIATRMAVAFTAVFTGGRSSPVSRPGRPPGPYPLRWSAWPCWALPSCFMRARGARCRT